MSKLFIPVVLGTAREGRSSEAAAKFVHAEVVAAGHDTELVDVRGHMFGETIPNWLPNEEKKTKTKAWRDIATRAHAFIIVTPEYNHGYPGELKLLLDSAMEEYKGKPLAIIGVSAGGLGGARMVEQLRLVSIELGMRPTKGAVYFSGIRALFGADGAIADESYKKRVADLLTELSSSVK